MLSFIVLPHSGIMSQTQDVIPSPVTFILTLGKPVLALAQKTECQAGSNYIHVVPFSTTLVCHCPRLNPVSPDPGADTTHCILRPIDYVVGILMLIKIPVSIINLSAGMEHITSMFSCVFNELENTIKFLIHVLL